MMDKNKERGVMPGGSSLSMMMQALGMQESESSIPESPTAKRDAAKAILMAVKADNAEMLMSALDNYIMITEEADDIFEIED